MHYGVCGSQEVQNNAPFLRKRQSLNFLKDPSIWSGHPRISPLTVVSNFALLSSYLCSKGCTLYRKQLHYNPNQWFYFSISQLQKYSNDVTINCCLLLLRMYFIRTIHLHTMIYTCKAVCIHWRNILICSPVGPTLIISSINIQKLVRGRCCSKLDPFQGIRSFVRGQLKCCSGLS